jgi:hypothetical protein
MGVIVDCFEFRREPWRPASNPSISCFWNESAYIFRTSTRIIADFRQETWATRRLLKNQRLISHTFQMAKPGR